MAKDSQIRQRLTNLKELSLVNPAAGVRFLLDFTEQVALEKLHIQSIDAFKNRSLGTILTNLNNSLKDGGGS